MLRSRLAALTSIVDHSDPTMPSGYLRVYPWRDLVVERVGHDACGDYVELFWLNSLGPTATWLLRRLAIITVTCPDGWTVDLSEMARALGLGEDTGPNSSLMRSLGRLLMFGLVRVEGRRLEVRAIIPPLPVKQCQRLPVHLQRAHAQWCDSDPHTALTVGFTGGTPQSKGMSRANDLALRLGEVQRQIDEQTRTETRCAS